MGVEGDKPDKRDQEDLWAPSLSPARIEALCDGVFAIAMTLLVFELSVPYLLGTPVSGHYPTSIMEMWPEFYVYVMGFLVLGVYWTLHKYMFHFIKRSDGVLVWLNVLFLMFAALVPFSTNVLKANRLLPGSPVHCYTASAFYYTSTIVTFLVLLGIWQYATRGYRLVDRDIDERIISQINKVFIVGVTLMAPAVVFSYFIPQAGYIGFLALAYVIAATAYGRHGSFFKRRTKSS